jgi:tetratricopeptide (TPR) repeat protein
LAEAAALHFNLAGQKEWFDRLEAEHDNLRAALHWTLQNAEAELTLRLAGALATFWIHSGYLTEGRNQLTRVLAATSGTQHVAWRANALYGAGRMALVQSDYPAARALCEQSLTLYERSGDRQGIANSLHFLALAARRQGDLATARSLHEQSLWIRRELNDTHGVANSLFSLALVLVEQADYRSARSLLEESADLFDGLGNRRGRAHVLVGLGEVARCLDEYDNAYTTYSEALAIFRELGDKMGSASALLNLGYVAYHEGDGEQAATLFAESLVLKRELDEINGIALCLAGLAGVSGADNQAVQHSNGARQGAMLLGAADGLLESIGARLPYADRIEYDRIADAVRSQLDEAAFQTAREEGRAMSLEQAVTYALGDQAELSSSDSP